MSSAQLPPREGGYFPAYTNAGHDVSTVPQVQPDVPQSDQGAPSDRKPELVARPLPSKRTVLHQHIQRLMRSANYHSVEVYECVVRGVAVMWRKSDAWVNSTQIFEAVGIGKDVIPGLLKQEVITGPHEIVDPDGGDEYACVWIPPESGRELAAIEYGLSPLLGPLFDFFQYDPDVSASGDTNSASSFHSVIKIYNKVYGSVQVYECMIGGIPVMRRRPDSWVNATQILKLAGLSKKERDDVIAKEIAPGPHGRVHIEGVDSNFCGVWIPLERARELAAEFAIGPLVGPLLDFVPQHHRPPPIPESIIRLPFRPPFAHGPQPQSGEGALPEQHLSGLLSPQGLLPAPRFIAPIPPGPPPIFSATYDSVEVYKCPVLADGIVTAVMLRKSDRWMKAEDVLTVAGINKELQASIIEKEVVPGPHEVVDAPSKLAGVWIPLERAKALATKHGAARRLQSVFDLDPAKVNIPKINGMPIKIYNAVYGSMQVLECVLRGIRLMMRKPDSWVNATQILKLAGIPKAKRDEIIKRDVLPGPHERVDEKDGRHHGIWVPLERGRKLAETFGVGNFTRRLFDFIISPDGMLAYPPQSTPPGFPPFGLSFHPLAPPGFGPPSGAPKHAGTRVPKKEQRANQAGNEEAAKTVLDAHDVPNVPETPGV